MYITAYVFLYLQNIFMRYFYGCGVLNNLYSQILYIWNIQNTFTYILIEWICHNLAITMTANTTNIYIYLYTRIHTIRTWTLTKDREYKNIMANNYYRNLYVGLFDFLCFAKQNYVYFWVSKKISMIWYI